MRRVEPKVFLIGETRVVEEGLRAFLEHIGVPDWQSDAPTDSEKVIEVMGRLCYLSFEPGLNPNVTKIREHNQEYLGNILGVKHGSVIEHPVMNFVFADVSRVFTHELVRHRVGRAYDDRDELRDSGLYEFITLDPGLNLTEGTAVSQESLRFVRFENLGFWVPSVIAENPKALELWLEKVLLDEAYQQKLTEVLGIPEMKSFHKKKEATSAIRRVVGMGVATNVGWSANVRTARWCLEARTHPGAEEELRLGFGKLGEIVTQRYPNLFGDFTVTMEGGLPWYQPKNSKV